jgi:hypothetical protein
MDAPAESPAIAETAEEPSLRAWLTLPSLAIAAIALNLTVPHYLIGDEPTFRSEIFQHLFVTQELFGALLAIGIVLVASILGQRTHRVIKNLVLGVARHPRAVIVVVLAVLAISTQVIYHRHPLSLDEYVPTFQAEVFAVGKIAAEFPPPLIRHLIPIWFINTFWAVSPQDGRVISGYWPGQALLLTPFTMLGIPWLLNPLLAAGALALLGYLARQLSGKEEAAGWAMLLALASPEFLVNGISFYSMTAHLFMNLLFVVLLLEHKAWRLVAAGFVGSVALVLHQPIPHMLVALPWFVFFVWRRTRWRALPWLAVGYLPLCLWLGIGWFYVRAGFQAQWDVVTQGGMAPTQGTSAFGSLFLELLASIFRIPDFGWLMVRLKGYLKLFLWAVPGLPILAWLGYRARRQQQTVQLIGAAVVCTVVVYLLVPASQGHGWGFRYFHQLWWVLPLLASLYLAELDRHSVWRGMVGCLLLLNLVFGTALRFGQVEGFISRHLAQLPPLDATQNQICFLSTQDLYYGMDLIQNDPFLRKPNLIFLSRDRQSDERLVRQLFPSARLVFEEGETTVWNIESPAGTQP